MRGERYDKKTILDTYTQYMAQLFRVYVGFKGIP
jgi:hypothetical protein